MGFQLPTSTGEPRISAINSSIKAQIIQVFKRKGRFISEVGTYDRYRWMDMGPL